ncbi:MAG: trimethylamine methyltransferase family protein [Solirubrobacteraceae bacterium]
MFVNNMPRYEVLSEDAMATLERGWRRLISEIGIEFAHEEALDLFRRAGQKVEGTTVFLDPEFVLDQIAKAPTEFALRSRNREKDIVLGGNHMTFSQVGGPPFVRSNGERRDGTLADVARFVELSEVLDEFDMICMSCEPLDRPLDSRHLDILQTMITRSVKPWMSQQSSREAVRDSLAMAEIVFGSRESIESEPVIWGVANVNSPMVYDSRMIDVVLEMSAANQPVIVTPFLLMGAMAPVSVPAALVQQIAEALAGITLIQLVRPGAPALLGSFLSHTDMQSGSPGFGGPEAAMGLLCSGQLARRFNLPWRSGGGSLTSSQLPDAQAAFEGLNTMLPAFLAGANYLAHAAGWLESGLVASYEKFMIDVEIVRILQAEFTPLEIAEESLAFGAHLEVGHGGHFFGTSHTLENFRDCFYRPIVASTENYERWSKNGERDTATRAARVCEQTLERYVRPELDPAIEEELASYVTRRRAELGD